MKYLFHLITLATLCNGMNVLISTPSIIKSLHGLLSHIALALGEAGHQVTFITPFPLTNVNSNVTVVCTDQMKKYFVDDMFMFRDNPSEFATYIKETTPPSVRDLWTDERVMEIWKNRNNFDIFMTISYFHEMNFPFLINFTGHFVQICTPGVEPVSLSREGNWLSPSVAPSILSNYDDVMNFWERMLSLPISSAYYFFQQSGLNVIKDCLHEFFPDIEPLSSYYDRVTLTLINGHFALDGSVPLLPSQIEIGTINTKKPQPLPKDLEDFIQGSGDAGIIYFSLGSIAKSSSIPQKAKEMFVEAFRRVPQRILWKYEGTDLQLPPNVKTQSWMPQQDILGHPKTRVFISHCGNLGTQEAKYHGVPTLGVPIAFDQPRNAARMERKGYAIVIQWEDMTTDKIVDALDKLINDTSYKDRLSTVSRVLQDQKESPAERAVYWMEYLVRHKGAPHLQYAGRRLSLYQYIMLDVILFWAAVLFIFIFLIVLIVKVVCCKGSKTKTDSKQTKKYHKKNQ